MSPEPKMPTPEELAEQNQNENKEVIPNSKIGLSLSFCVKDILRGNIKEEEVKEIIAGTDASLDQWDELMKNYKENVWLKNPEECEAIARRLYEAGKIKQPRQEDKKAHHMAGGWIEADKFEEWEKKRNEE